MANSVSPAPTMALNSCSCFKMPIRDRSVPAAQAVRRRPGAESRPMALERYRRFSSNDPAYWNFNAISTLVLEFRLFRASRITLFLPHGRSISHAQSLANWDPERNCDPYLAVLAALKTLMQILAKPGSFLSGSSLSPARASQALRGNVQYNISLHSKPLPFRQT